MKFQWKNCSEEALDFKVGEWLRRREVVADFPRMLILLEGEMGAGKSTFVRAMLKHLCPSLISHGSPTFPIVTEYEADDFDLPIYHIDLYRLKNEAEIHDSGIDDLLDRIPSLVCVEWASMFPGYFEYFLKPEATLRRKVIQVKITQSGENRDYTVSNTVSE